MGEWLLSRRDRLIVARHEVPGERCRAAPSQRDGRRHCQFQEREQKVLAMLALMGFQPQEPSTPAPRPDLKGRWPEGPR
jgi:hypothetical protein